ncbi:hypothetical protein Ga0100231_023290 [Opitutaceae bacterium TAV4]|nr:hypothetical protein Ga0100231_023290 [Opitutaceae bacterium TAV4]RRK02432.1 hypothetical protein Ga0100230_004620 [Opitutaceae bacterium TAV3]
MDFLAYIRWDSTGLVCCFVAALTLTWGAIFGATAWFFTTIKKALKTEQSLAFTRNEMEEEREQLNAEIAKLEQQKKTIRRLVEFAADSRLLTESNPDVFLNVKETTLSPNAMETKRKVIIQSFYAP